jgi:hemerythrin superfamily protein
MASDAVSLIEQDHREMEALFDRVLAGDGDRQALVDEITARLTAHARAEEEEVYPAITKADPSEEAEVDHAYDEHHEAEHLLRKARNLVATAHFEDAFTAFVGAVKHHVQEEETEVLPALRDAVDAKTLVRLGAAFDRVRRDLLGAPVTTVPPEASAVPDEPAEDATRDELYEMAKRADIHGRSTMTKQELAEALRDNV